MLYPSNVADNLIKRFEGCKLTSYRDLRGIWTIGYGQTGSAIHSGLTITQIEADNFLKNKIHSIHNYLKTAVVVPLKQGQVDALISFIYNIGEGAFTHSTMLKCINDKRMDDAYNEFIKWDHVNGIVIPGLLTRRMSERSVFIS